MSRFGVIPKQHKRDLWQLIVELSHPLGFSVNDGIPKDLCSLHYISIDDAINQITKLGSGTLLVKANKKSAFAYYLFIQQTHTYFKSLKWIYLC